MDLAFDNLQRLICHKTQTNKQIQLDISREYSEDPIKFVNFLHRLGINTGMKFFL